MPFDANAVRDLKQQLKEGEVRFRFEGKREGDVVFWAELLGHRSDTGRWTSEIRLGNGNSLKNEVSQEGAERHFTALWVSLHEWLANGKQPLS